MTALPPFRHLEYGADATIRDIGAAGIVALLDGGDLDDWRPLLREIESDPWGPVAARMERMIDHLETYGTGAAMRSWLERCRVGGTGPKRIPTHD